MKPAIFKEANKIWVELAKDASDKQLNFELEIHKKLLEFFQVGDYYYYVFNVKRVEFEFISSEIFNVLGYLPENIEVPFFLSNIHPDDQPWFLNFENKVAEFLTTLTPQQIPNYKIRYDYRIKKKNGEYIRILQQVVTIQYEEPQGVLRTFGVHTDITHIKKEGTPVLSFIELNGEPSYINVEAKKVYATDNLHLSKREKEILFLLIKGMTTKQISESLFISEWTVKTHRKNILQKTDCPNVTSLISNAIRKGWI